MDKNARTLLVVSLIWLVVLAFSVFFEVELYAAFSILAALCLFHLYAVGIVLIVVTKAYAVGAKPRSEWRGFLAPLLVPVVTLLLLYFVGTDWVFPFRFQFRKAHYEAEVARIQAAKPEQREKVAGRNVILEPGKPLRIAFVQPGGILDNYTAVIYDPSGLVMQANLLKPNAASWNDPKLARVKKLFHGDLVWAEPLGGPWYRCGFT